MIDWLEENELTLSVDKNIKCKLSDKSSRSSVTVQLVGIKDNTVRLLENPTWVITAHESSIENAIKRIWEIISGETIVVEQIIQPENIPFNRDRLAVIVVPDDLFLDEVIEDLKEFIC